MDENSGARSGEIKLAQRSPPAFVAKFAVIFPSPAPAPEGNITANFATNAGARKERMETLEAKIARVLKEEVARQPLYVRKDA